MEHSASLKAHLSVPMSAVRQKSTSHLIFKELDETISSEREKLLKLSRAVVAVNFLKLCILILSTSCAIGLRRMFSANQP